MSSDAQILAPPGVSREEADPRRWVALLMLLDVTAPVSRGNDN
jgi:hypothetical protein